MKVRPVLRLAVVGAICVASQSIVGQADDIQYSWQKPHAKVLPSGNLQWALEPYVFNAGDSIRYIDYENGDDGADGKSRTAAWKHHPWDRDATGDAAEVSGPITYVFKGGVAYRGQLSADESGEPDNPIRLTYDPAWGEGKPWLLGSTRLSGRWVRATEIDAPPRLPDPDKVWALDLKPTGLLDTENKILFTHPSASWNRTVAPPFYGLFLVGEEGVETLHLARSPDWQAGGESFAMDYWHQWDGGVKLEDAEGKEFGAVQDDDLKGFPHDYFTGGYLWSQYPLFMGTPAPRYMPEKVEADKRAGETPFYFPEEGAFRMGLPGGVKPRVRYLIENLPQYLDAANEFYLDENTGILFLRLAEGADPNTLRIELSTDYGQIEIDSRSHIEIAGLKFSFARGATIGLHESTTNVTIRHCDFIDVAEVGVSGRMKMARTAPSSEFMDKIRVTDCNFQNAWETGVKIADGSGGSKFRPYGRLGHVEVLRNNFHNTGMRHAGAIQSNVPTLYVGRPTTGEVAGNIVRRSFGSGIVVFGGKEGNLGDYARRATELPLIRIFVHHNLTQHTALGVNDYGGLAIWQGGPIYAYSNVIGSSPGHMPGGFWGIPMTNLSYPLYLDGAYKIYCFNNLIWGASTDDDDPYRSKNSAYFMVFGFLNQFVNNTVYRHGKGVGGSSGNRCDVLGNVFSEIKDSFLANNRVGDPSLVGGGDDASSGMRGVPSLAFGANVFHGQAEAGAILKQRYDKQDRPLLDIPREIAADTIPKMTEQMQQFPIRYGELGVATEERPIVGAAAEKIHDSSEVDFRLVKDSVAVDRGVRYFVPFSLYGTVGEWHFTENHADPQNVTDYHWYMTEAHIYRMIYEHVPVFDLRINQASLDDFVASPSETWTGGALRFDGSRFARYPDAALRQDIRIPIGRFREGKKHIPEGKAWKWIESPEGETYAQYPAEMRKTLAIGTENLLLEANVRINSGHTGGTIVSKHDGDSGYRLIVNAAGSAEFQIAPEGKGASVATAAAINDGQWHHVLAEIDRATGEMRIYLDGKLSTQRPTSLGADASLDCRADFLVGKASDDSDYLKGAVDFLRICQGTLADAGTTIEELYEWQTSGPFHHDFRGRKPKGTRDAGAIELVE
ncbi:MAG: LamG-like jellyroll fold domain-containing protein [bacterium]